MQVTITRTIQIPDEIESINELEGRIHIFGLRLMREILCEVWQLCQRLRWACEACGSDRITGEGYRDYGVMTVFGRVKLKRHRVKCHECTSLSQPADSMLKEVRGGHASIRFAELASLSGASWPYEQAATVLERMVGDRVSHEQVRRLTNRHGQDAVEAQLGEADGALERHVEPSAGVDGPQMVNVAIDGGWVRSRDNPNGMEGKVGVVYVASEKVGEHRRSLSGRRYAAMDEFGIQMIYALSPQAKGRVERAAGTFQDRLVTELRLAGATTIGDAGVALRDFLPHFNERFGVSAPESEVAHRPVDGGTCLDRMLCFRHSRKVAKDNTVRYRRSTLQLLPGMERPTYAGVKVDVLEGLDGQLVVEHEGQLIPSQEAPPRPNILRGVNGYPSHAPPYRNGLDSRWERVLASLDRERAEENDGNHDSGAARIRKKATSAPRKPTPKQIARWEAVHAAKRRGLSIRAITRETGIHRETVRKYLKTDSPPMNRPRVMLKAS